MQSNDEAFWKPVEKQLREAFRQWYFQPLVELVQAPKSVINSKSALIAAINSGRISYSDGVFRGSFSASISRELAKFADFDRRSGVWRGRPPADILASAIIANDRAAELNRRISDMLPQLQERAEQAIAGLSMNIEPTIIGADRQLSLELEGLGVPLDITDAMREQIAEEYSENMRLWVKNWNEEQILRLRSMVEENIASGLNRNRLIESIKAEWDTTQKKAVFLARQETSLFLSEYSNARYQGAGLRFYQWMNSGDVRVVGNPAGKYPEPSKGHGNHWTIGGKICRFDDATLYADSIEDAVKGIWKSKAMIGADNRHPGESFLCRCVKKPIIT